MKKNTEIKDKRAGLQIESGADFPLAKNNFVWMGVAGAMIVLGFLLMLGGGSTSEFNPDIFSVRRIVVGPAISFIGFIVMGVAIILRPRK